GSTAALTANIPSFTAGAVNPAGALDVLATVQAEPQPSSITTCATTNQATAVAVGEKSAGGTTSTVVYVGIEPYNIQAQTGQGTAQQFMNGILTTYAGLP
ncbi:MAG TPA: hypothetical protein VMB50_22895, partial [Myxococcales bacterium]|nr:hypothetical protein [Myxococcales bacterium]